MLETLLVAMNVITVALEAVSAIVYEEIGQPRWVGSVASTLQVTGLVGKWCGRRRVHAVDSGNPTPLLHFHCTLDRTKIKQPLMTQGDLS